MSYAVTAAPSRASRGSHGTPVVSVGPRAHGDIALAFASRQAAEILRDALTRPRGQRLSYMRSAMRRYGPGAREKFDQELGKLRRAGRKEDQARFDAMRLVAANRLIEQGLEVVRAAAAQVLDVSRAGLGDTGLDVGCGITGGLTAVLATVAAIYTGGAGAPIVGAGGSIIANQIGCGANAQAAAQQTAAEQAAAAAAIADAASRQLAAEEAATDRVRSEQRKTLITAGAIGGGLLLLLGVGYAIVKV